MRRPESLHKSPKITNRRNLEILGELSAQTFLRGRAHTNDTSIITYKDDRRRAPYRFTLSSQNRHQQSDWRVVTQKLGQDSSIARKQSRQRDDVGLIKLRKSHPFHGSQTLEQRTFKPRKLDTHAFRASAIPLDSNRVDVLHQPREKLWDQRLCSNHRPYRDEMALPTSPA